MKTFFSLVLAALACLALGVASARAVSAQDKDVLHTPAKGSAERQAIMDAVRDDYEKNGGGRVIFTVDYLKVHRGWAWVDSTPLDKNGRPVAEGGTSLLHYEDGKWRVMDLSKVPEDPDNPMGAMSPTPRYTRNLLRTFPGVPADIIPKVD